MKLPQYIMSLDVETVGLYGQPFAWAVVIREAKPGGKVVTETVCVCPFEAAMGTEDDKEWVRANVLPAMRGKIELAVDFGGTPISMEAGNVDELLEKFVDFWDYWSKLGTWILVDHGYPVEAEFLFMAFMIAFSAKKDFGAPYPVLDYASMKAARGDDPTASEPRFSSELPVHHPLCDARQTLRLAWPLIIQAPDVGTGVPVPLAIVHESDNTPPSPKGEPTRGE